MNSDDNVRQKTGSTHGMTDAVSEALNALTDVKAYTLTAEEIRDFKAAQYALRNLSTDHAGDNDVPGVYDD